MEKAGLRGHEIAVIIPREPRLRSPKDRWAMLLAGTTNIRDVIAFPKNQRARDLMTGAPAPVDEKQLRELGIK